MRRHSQLRHSLLIFALVAVSSAQSLAADIETMSGLYFRLPFAADGTGPERPRVGMGFGPSALPRAGFSLELNADGLTRLGIAGYDWHWQVPAPEEWGSDLRLFDGSQQENPSQTLSDTEGLLPNN